MSTNLADSALLTRYYAILTGGGESYAGGRDLLPLLSEDFEFDGPIAGHVAGAAPFARGVQGFVETVRRISFLQTVVTAAGAAVLYDAELPHGTVRFSEFFQLDGATIRALRLQYTAADYLAAGGR